MNDREITRLRLHNQRIAGTKTSQPHDIVSWLGAVQAQDYPGARWAVGLRSAHATDEDINQALASGSIIRTHILRPTWHFVTPDDIRWMLALTAPRVKAANGYYYRQLELNDTLFARANDALVKALEGGKELTRRELVAALQNAGIVSRPELAYSLIGMNAELDGILVSGALRGKQFTYALLDERVPQSAPLSHDEALARLASRYFTSRGPATVKDFAWWSGLTIADARAGLQMAAPGLEHEVVDGNTYWLPRTMPVGSTGQEQLPSAYLLPDYDEYMVAYKDRSAAFDTSNKAKLEGRGEILFHYVVVVEGRVVGTWKHIASKSGLVIEKSLFAPLGATELEAVSQAEEAYSRFVGLPLLRA